MAQQRLRPGPWKIIENNTADREIQIDYEKFEVPRNTTVEFEVTQMGLYDDTSLTAYRNPVSTVTSTTNVGGPVDYSMIYHGMSSSDYEKKKVAGDL